MTKLIRSHLSMMYDELWSEHIKLSLGKVIKPFKDRVNFSWTTPRRNLKKDFRREKPAIFTEFDEYLIKKFTYNTLIGIDHVVDIIKYADNRMAMEDYRYGSITRQNLNNYDVAREFTRRMDIALNTKNLEYLVDAYNMLRIEAFKLGSTPYSEQREILGKNIKLWELWLLRSYYQHWKLVSIDDGIHAQEK